MVYSLNGHQFAEHSEMQHYSLLAEVVGRLRTQLATAEAQRVREYNTLTQGRGGTCAQAYVESASFTLSVELHTERMAELERLLAFHTERVVEFLGVS